MPTDEQFDELVRQIAALTERIYKLEQRLGLRTSPQPVSVPPPPTVPVVPDIESKIGGHWLNRVGIVAVLIGVAYFLKYAFDNEWVGPSGRVLIGLIAGLATVVWGEYVRRRGYALFSYSLSAVGIGILYLSLWASSPLYQLIPASLAFFAMGTVTAATVALALWQDSEVIAAFAALGAFITPVALSDGQNNAASLFAYILVLDLGALVLTRYRPWSRVLIGSFLGSLILYTAWHSQFYTTDQFYLAMVAVSSIFTVYLVAPFAAAHDRETKAIALLALANAPFYFYEVWELFDHAGQSRQSAVAAVALACVYFFVASLLSDRSREVLARVHWSIGAVLMVIAVPLGLNGKWITMGWLFEAGALIEIGRRSQKEYLKFLGASTLVLGLIRLVAVDDFDVTRLVFNERIVTFAFAIAACTFVARSLAASVKRYDRDAAAALIVTINLLALIALNSEVHDAFFGIVRSFAYSALWMTYGAALMFVGFWKKSRFLRWQALVLIAITVGKVFLFDTSSLDRGYRILSLIALGLILLGTSFWYQRKWFKVKEQ